MDNLPQLSNSDVNFICEENSFTLSLSDMDMLLPKQEHLLPVNNCVHQDPSFNLGQNLFPMDLLPDSTANTGFALVPLSTSYMPSKENYPGPCDFDVEFSKTEGEKARWEYSESLNKLYVVMGGKVPVKFKWNQEELGLCVRAVPIFLAQDDFAEPVRRCPSHMLPEEASNKGFPDVDHIIRCHTTSAVYEKNVESKRLSVITPIDCPQPGCNWSTIVYSFVCKNSCIMGMNRRGTAIIFTLERPNGEVIGRKLINMRVCSCPRRDMGKDEIDAAKKADSEQSDNEPVNEDLSDGGSHKATEVKKMKVKKPLKRLSNMPYFIIRARESNFKRFAKVVVEMIHSSGGPLTPEDEIVLEDCAKYLK